MSLIWLLFACVYISGSSSEGDVHTNTPKTSIDERIVNAASSRKGVESFNNGKVRKEYDMVFSQKRWDDMDRRSRLKRAMPVKARNGILSYRWTNGHIPYEFVEDDFTPNERENIVNGMKVWENYTCLTFGPSKTGNRMVIKDGELCDSEVGMVGGAQNVHLAIGCRFIEPAIHEFGHAIGLIHEQSRPDRDNYVKIVEDNIPKSQLNNFRKTPKESLDDLGIPYDYLSIMHYGGKAFSGTGEYTIETIDKDYQKLIGTAEKPSFLDIKTVNLMYKCRQATKGCSMTDTECPGEGFVGKDCKCWCKGDPYVYCSSDSDSRSVQSQGSGQGAVKRRTSEKGGNTNTGGGKASTGGSKATNYTKEACKDRHNKCSYWADRKECSKNPNYMLVNCKKSCNKCGADSALETACVDRHINCSYWADHQECSKNPSYMLETCKKSCDKCGTRATMQTAPAQKSTCEDNNSDCEAWADKGECQKHSAYMLKYCKKACAVCS